MGALLRLTVSALLAAGVASAVALTLFIERSLNRPIRLLLASMAAVERGDLAEAPRLPRKDEMGDLAVGYGRMLRRIRESHPTLGEYLAARIKTGYLCGYSADPGAVVWEL